MEINAMASAFRDDMQEARKRSLSYCDEALADDLLFFTQNPGRRLRARWMTEGEEMTWMDDPDQRNEENGWTPTMLVEQIRPGCVWAHPVFLPGIEDPEAISEAKLWFQTRCFEEREEYCSCAEENFNSLKKTWAETPCTAARH
jgi:hypothetical protein